MIIEAITATTVPKTSEIPSPPNTESGIKNILPSIVPMAVKSMGFVRVAVEVAMASTLLMP